MERVIDEDTVDDVLALASRGFAPLGASKQLQEKLQTKALALLGEESERRPRVLAVVRQPDAHRLRGVEKAISVAYELILDHKRTRLRTAELALARQAASDSTPPTFSSPHSEARRREAVQCRRRRASKNDLRGPTEGSIDDAAPTS